MNKRFASIIIIWAVLKNLWVLIRQICSAKAVKTGIPATLCPKNFELHFPSRAKWFLLTDWV